MASLVLTQVTFFLCAALFVRLFTYQRGPARYRWYMSALAVLVMLASGRTMIDVLQGRLLIPFDCWPLVVMLAVFVAGVWLSRGNLAAVMRPETAVYTGPDRRQPSDAA